MKKEVEEMTNDVENQVEVEEMKPVKVMEEKIEISLKEPSFWVGLLSATLIGLLFGWIVCLIYAIIEHYVLQNNKQRIKMAFKVWLFFCLFIIAYHLTFKFLTGITLSQYLMNI